ncbi:MAG: isoamylase early set domain-containing protein [Candidatus Omnitrophica bacterium]|nr:isoamylase early set domain-containing protein [Candidatus Omnitrophota bacterium]
MAIAQKPTLTRRATHFEFQAPATAQRVALVGDFNSWNHYSHRMRKATSGLWEATVELAPGRYQYKFLVNDSQWLTDLKAKGQASNQYGTTNSVIEVK